MPDADSLPRPSPALPHEVVQCLENARFLHLATSSPDAVPHISLMNYTYLPTTPFSSTPQIVMTTEPTSHKTDNLRRNPRVSLLVHDWVSTRPPTLSSSGREGSPPPAGGGAARSRSSLATLLLGINSAALSRISATINGDAVFVPHGSDEEKWLKARHLENNTFGDEMEDPAGAGGGPDLFGTSPTAMHSGDGGRLRWVEGEEVKVVVVKIKDGRISDWKGQVTDWSIAEANGASAPPPLVNGF